MFADFQKCGEIIVAPKSNKIAMICNFCHQIFKQLHAFMRHLQLQHDNELDFLKQSKETEVYTVEELMNQTIASCTTDIECENDLNGGLSESIMNLINRDDLGDSQYDKQTKYECGNEVGLSNKGNKSILKALEDCDVSFNLMDNLYDTSSLEEKKENIDSTLEQEVQNNFKDCDPKESISQIKDIENNMRNSTEIVSMGIGKDISMSKDNSMSDFINPHGEENLNELGERFEDSTTICFKNLLGLENLDKLDSLLENLESNLPTPQIKEENDKEIFNCNKVLDSKLCLSVKNNTAENKVVNRHNFTNNGMVLLNSKLAERSKYTRAEKLLQSEKLLHNANFDFESQKLYSFEARLKELENALGKVVVDINNISFQKTNEICKVPKISTEKNFVNDHFDLKLKDSLIDDNNDERNINCSKNDIEVFEKNKSSILGETVANSTQILNEDNSNILDETPLNEVLTKVLADALDDGDLDLLNIRAGEESEDLLNEDIFNLLEQEVTEKEIDHQVQSVDTLDIKENKLIETTNIKNIPLNIHMHNKIDFKEDTMAYVIQNENIQKPHTNFVLKDYNTINNRQIGKKSTDLKEKGEIFLQQHSFCLKDYANYNFPETNNQGIEINPQRKTPKKKNQENCFHNTNIRKIKNQNVAPSSIFVNTVRGDKTPINSKELFLKPSQEKPEAFIKNTNQKCEETSKEKRKIKKSPAIQDKQKCLMPQYVSPNVVNPKTPQITNKTKCNPSPKTNEISGEQSHINKTPRNNNLLICKEQKPKSPLKCVKSSNKTHYTPTKIVTDSNNLHNGAKTSATTPQILKNVSIKLQRFTPEKITQVLKNQDISKQITEHFKLPNGLSLKIVPKKNSSVEASKIAIPEIPIETKNYCKGNISESSLKNIQMQEIKKRSPKDRYSLKQAQSRNIESLNAESIFLKRQRKASIDILPSSTKEESQKSSNKTPRSSNLDSKSYVVNRSLRKKELIQRMRNIKKQIFKSIEKSECETNVGDLKAITNGQKNQKCFIEDVQILPNLDKETSKIFTNFKKPFEKNITLLPVLHKKFNEDQNKSNISNNDLPINNNEIFIKKSLKRRAPSPLLNQNNESKRQRKSQDKEQKEVIEKTTDFETTQIGLSGNAMRDLKENRIEVESLLGKDLPEDDTISDTLVKPTSKNKRVTETMKDDCSFVINELLEQVENEENEIEKTQNGNVTNKKDSFNNSDSFEDFDDYTDINLLDKFGLKIIKLPEIEDTISLEERDEMIEKALKFAKIYRHFPKIWSAKNGENHILKKELNMNFMQMLTETKESFSLDLSIAELKHLVNLINIWYTHNFNSKLIEKRKISESINRYLLMFNFMPKTIKRLCYCEYCEEYFNTEHKYFTHRIIHTGALFPYKCQKCLAGFKAVRYLKAHDSSCNAAVNIVESAVKPNANTNMKSKTQNRKCLLCGKIFSTSELLYEHSKTHLKTIYNCDKCELVFACEMDVQNHMAASHIGKRIPKPLTPRLSMHKAE